MIDNKLGIEQNSFFNLTFYDIITHLIPGVAFLLIFYFTNDFRLSTSKEILLIALLVFGYITGHVLSIIGNILFVTYFHPKNYERDSVKYFLVSVLHKFAKIIIRQNYKNTASELKEKIKKLARQKLGLKLSSNLELFQLCDVLALKVGCSERNILLAKQGFYRSLVALIVLLIPYILIKQGINYNTLFLALSLTVLLRLILHIHVYYGEIRRSQIRFLAYIKLKQMRKLK